MSKIEATYFTYLAGLPGAFGELRLLSDGHALTAIDFDGGSTVERPLRGQEPATWQRADDLPVLQKTKAELREFFAGTRTEFTVPLRLTGTDFQRQVWAELCRIPYGATWSYVELARRIGRPQASRAVGAANGKNPVPIIVPCHRVIGASGQLTGYGGGLPRKQQLLQIELGARQNSDYGLPLSGRQRSPAG
jgi:methylated-DNA-[protein]-cysteine S-methyltransferase